MVPVNPKGGTIFGYEAVTSISTIDPPVDLAVIVIRPDAILDAMPRSGGSRHSQSSSCPAASPKRGQTAEPRNEAPPMPAACR